MAKRIKALVLAVALVITLVAAPVGSFAVDATTSASTWTPTTPAAPVNPTAPATTAPTAPTPKPVVVAPEFAIPTITRVLHFGTSGTDVTLLQKYLNKVGNTVTVDGIFGNTTVAAVKAFQTKAGLVADGYVGKLTNKALYDAAGQTDAITTASLVNEVAALKAGLSADGKWIVSTLRNLVSKEALVVDGKFLNGKKDKVTGEDVIQRKLSLYTQDENKKVTARFTLTAPKLTVNSPNFRIQSGTFIGDIYVNAEGFQLVDAKVEGNVYYTTQAVKDTAKIDAKSVVTGEVALIELDVVATPSLAYDKEVFKRSLWATGPWIICNLKDMTFDEPLVLNGDILNSRGAVQRKLALYSQDDKRNVTRRFTVTAPSLTILSANARIQGGIFKGDVYVTTPDFQLVDATVDGNIYFTNEAAKAGFKYDAKSTITGEMILTELDAVASPSLYRDEETLAKNLSKEGTWIIYAGNDLTTDKPLFLDGEFSYRNTVQRKIALYSQDDARKVTRRFTLTAPALVVNSPNTRLEKGDFVGDIYVSEANFRLNEAKVTGDIYVGPFATGFKMDKTTVTGNVYYATQKIMDAAIIDSVSTVSGVSEVK
jgi:peptidoglycan hydrolase-like protein with peptidoglycan-binding domain